LKKRPEIGSVPPLGWQGIVIPLPDEWSLTAFSGDWDAGYLRAEGPNEASLELKWKHDRASPSLKGLLKGYVQQLNRAAGRKGADVTLKEKPKALSSVPQGSGVSQTFSWKTSVYGIGAVWHCLECRRIVLAQITAPEQAVADALAKRVIPKIADHPEGDDCYWSVYGFSFFAPKAFRLEKQSLRSGHLSLELRHKSRRLVAERYGPANVLLKRDRLADWATAVKPIFEHLKPFAYKKETLPAETGHEAVKLAGRRRSARDKARRIGLWLIRRQAPDALEARIWRCEASNRIYVTLAEATPREAEKLADDVSETIRCHDGEPGTD
jgi:hypothetical protein